MQFSIIAFLTLAVSVMASPAPAQAPAPTSPAEAGALPYCPVETVTVTVTATSKTPVGPTATSAPPGALFTGAATMNNVPGFAVVIAGVMLFV